MNTVQKVVAYTNNSLQNRFANAKRDYNVIGSGKCRIEGDSVIVDYVENGEHKTWSMAFYPEYLKSHPIEWVFNCWMELV